MDDKSQVVKHLEMIQGVVNRLSHDFFLIKGWSMTLLVGGIIFITRNEIQTYWFICAFLIPVIGFWILDGYFLWQERLFRDVYNDFRKRKITDFEMNPMKHENSWVLFALWMITLGKKHSDKPRRSWLSSIFSVTLNMFYGIEILFVAGVFFILKYQGSY